MSYKESNLVNHPFLMIFYHFTTLRCFRKEVQREGV